VHGSCPNWQSSGSRRRFESRKFGCGSGWSANAVPAIRGWSGSEAKASGDMKLGAVLAMALLFGSGAVVPSSARADSDGNAHCKALGSFRIAGGTLSSVQPFEAGQYRPPVPDPPYAPRIEYSQLPPFCRVVGSLAPTRESQIGFELWLPADWNGRLLQVGNGGAAGAIVYSALADGLRRGYAVVNTDTGHKGEGGDFSWAKGHRELLIDFAYRAVHEVTQASRKLTTYYYAKPPSKSYWSGCSTGGRQGLMEVQRFPNDFDGVVAGAPAYDWAALMLLGMKIARHVGTPNGVPVNKLSVLKSAYLQHCDLSDGLADRVVNQPARCSFDPAVTLCTGTSGADCLNKGELAAARAAYAGVLSPSGQVLFPGTGPGSELEWGAYASPQFHIGGSFYQNVAAPDAAVDLDSVNLDGLLPALQSASQAIVAAKPDIEAFFAHGGKLLMYHGTTDGLIPSGSTEKYYKRILQKTGQKAVAEHVRFFPVPGMGHCMGGEGSDHVDWLAALEQWENTGTPPEELVGTHSDPAKSYSRPVCSYPNVPRYAGAGSDTDAGYWRCSTP